MTASSTSVVLYVRSLSETAFESWQRSVIERLQRLSAAGGIDGFEVQVWGKQLVLSGPTIRTACGRRFLDQFRRLQRWAEENDASLEPYFAVRDVTCEPTGEAFTVVSFPVAALIERRDGAIVSVAPRTTPAGTTSVDDRLDALERGLPEGRSPRTEGPDRSTDAPPTADSDR